MKNDFSMKKAENITNSKNSAQVQNGFKPEPSEEKFKLEGNIDLKNLTVNGSGTKDVTYSVNESFLSFFVDLDFYQLFLVLIYFCFTVLLYCYIIYYLYKLYCEYGFQDSFKILKTEPQQLRETSVTKGMVSPKLRIDTKKHNVLLPDYALNGRPKESPPNIICYIEDEAINKQRKAARLARKMLEFAKKLAVPGVSTDDIDKAIHKEILSNGAYPTPLNYYGFPKSVCTSVNEVVCHGIPDDRILCDGDIISIDVSLYTEDGLHGDNCGTVAVGTATQNTLDLIQATQTAVDKAIAVCAPGVCISKIGEVIEDHATAAGYSVIHEFCGHGLGPFIHMQPLIHHYKNNIKIPMKQGMVFTIEPILVEGSNKISWWDDGWTTSTKDCGRSAQIEHEVLITADGVEVLTIL